jgi:hypothetical protein
MKAANRFVGIQPAVSGGKMAEFSRIMVRLA